MLEVFLGTFATLFVVIDPPGLAPISVSLTQNFGPARQRKIIVTAAILAMILLTVFGLIGEKFLQTIGIGMPAFRISGGILLFIIALEMLFQKRAERREQTAKTSDEEYAFLEDDPGEVHEQDPTVFPLTLPLIAGPGAMTTMILLVGEYSGDYAKQAIVFGTAYLTIGLVVIFTLAFARIAKFLGKGGINVMTRLLGILLAALAVQFVADGVLALWP